jgi:hypothetical protein
MAGCGGAEPKTPVNASEVNGAATEKSSEGANHCGAGKDHKAGEAACAAKPGDAKPADTTAAKPADTTPAAATPAAATPAAATPAAATGTTPAPATTTGKKTPPAPAAAPAKKGGSGSCGAGTCSAKK